MRSSPWDNIEIPESKLEEIDDLKRMRQWGSLIGALLEIRRNIILRLETVSDDEQVRNLAAEYRAIVKITNPLLLPPVDRSDY